MVGRFDGMLLLSAKCARSLGRWEDTSGDSENHSEARSYRSVQWLNIIRFSAEDQSRLHRLGGKKVLPGIFLGYALIAG